MMENIIKKVLYTGVGIVASATERVQHIINDLVDRGKISEDEGKKVVDDVVKNTENKREEYEGRFRKIIEGALSKINLPRGDVYEKLEKRIKSLEVKVGLLAKEIESQKEKSKPAATSGRKSKKAAADDAADQE